MKKNQHFLNGIKPWNYEEVPFILALLLPHFDWSFNVNTKIFQGKALNHRHKDKIKKFHSKNAE